MRSDLDATLAELRDASNRLNALKSSLPPKRDYWRQYVPDLPETPDFAPILDAIAALGERFQAVAQAKKSSPLEPLTFPDDLTAALELYAETRASFLNAYQDFLDANTTIRRIKLRKQVGSATTKTNVGTDENAILRRERSGRLP